MILRLPYGRGALTADLRGLRCHHLAPTAPRAAMPPRELVAAALDQPDGCPRLSELASGRESVALLVPDATRKAWLEEVLPAVLERLQSAGVTRAATTVVVACGTHPASDARSLQELVGPLPPGVTLLQHDARDVGDLVPVGSLSSGLPVRINRRVAEADLIVGISTVQHHYYAGFGGGPKLVFPGVAGYEEIQANHSKVLELTGAEPRRHPGCEPGMIAGNPVAEEIRATAALRPPELLLVLVAGRDGRPAWAAAGGLDRVYPTACEQVRRWYEVGGGPFDKVVVTAGGYPGDDTLIQAHKALDAACRFLNPGGEALFVAACGGGPGSPDMAPFLEEPSPEAILARLAERYVQYGHTTLRLVEKTARFVIHAVTGLDDALAERLGLLPLADAQIVLNRWREESPGETVGVMAGATVYPAQP